MPDPAELLKRLAALPPFPNIAVKLLAISVESETAIEEYEEVFKSDPALATELLRAANSTEFGLVAKVDRIRQALTLLGLDRVYSLAITLAMGEYARQTPRLQVLQPLWAHALTTAVIAETMGAIRGGSTSSLYTAALVHDVGRLGLLMAAGTPYAKLLAQPVASREHAAVLEREQFGLTHGEAGEIMAKTWGFPPWLCDVIRYHDQQENLPTEERFRLSQAACLYSNVLGHGEHGDPRGANAALQLPADLRGQKALEPERLRQRVSKLLFTVSRAPK